MLKKKLTDLLNIKVLFGFVLLLNIFVIVHIFQEKQAFHSDEQWSYASANSSKGAYLDVEIDSYFKVNDNIRQRLFNHWIKGSVLHNHLTVQQKERFTYHYIYENLKKDAHPPLYYILLHTVSSFFPDSFNKWHSGSLNIVFFILIYFALFKLSKMLLKDNILSLCCVALWGFSEIGIDTVVFLRMYILQTLLSICLVYEVLKIIQKNTASRRQLFFLFLYSFLNILTQYNSIFFSFFVALVACLILLKRKNYKLMFSVGCVMALSVVMLFIAFPPASEILFGSMQGRQVLSALQNTSEIGDNSFNFLWQVDLRLSKLIDMFALHFFTFKHVNYQMLTFFLIIGVAYKYMLKCQNEVSTVLLLSVTVLYCLYLFSMPYMGIFHSRYFMSVAPFLAIFTVMLINWLCGQARLKTDCIALIVVVLVAINSIRLNFAEQSPYAFRWGTAESETAQKIKDNDVFINAGQDVIALHSMIYYLKNARRVYITEDICENQVLSDISNTDKPVILTYSSYIGENPAENGVDCLQNIGFYKVAAICPSQRCYNVWQENRK